jgi:hypothetical protein
VKSGALCTAYGVRRASFQFFSFFFQKKSTKKNQKKMQPFTPRRRARIGDTAAPPSLHHWHRYY